ncbi:Appr-1-p processing domain-containing protein [Trypanosoma rangeli]|uniref:Appr-1-p processing domain-containing protein n=1 Tax=Trypanosoma rangeli TaxID=5698 RepID=A0A422MZ70_TRYRA|nr:Appr-1-p processing domain-containing protein [Trypanosoma rangeli]RNE98522.1 Appr-1-p processing domain-containing protein [Trypanosoma rangeli]|eukprot:RNE98522.1 Appr-1-p processing domain-containing protein [Trypanosoma rangeli]
MNKRQTLQESTSKQAAAAGEEGNAGTPIKFVTYSGTEPAGLKGEPRRTSPSRAHLLAPPLSPVEKAVFDMPIEKWKTVDRSTLPGWRCTVPHPVTLSDLTPVSLSHPILQRIALYKGPVTDLQLDAIVNATSTRCLGGGGVDGAVHTAAGPLLLRECATFSGCGIGQCRITKGYGLPARYVLHTVGPTLEKPEFLRSCYRSILSLAHQNRLRTVGFCCVATGVYGYPLLSATRIAVSETVAYLKKETTAFDLCCFACFRPEEYTAYTDCLRECVDAAPTPSVES